MTWLLIKPRAPIRNDKDPCHYSLPDAATEGPFGGWVHRRIGHQIQPQGSMLPSVLEVLNVQPVLCLKSPTNVLKPNISMQNVNTVGNCGWMDISTPNSRRLGDVEMT